MCITATKASLQLMGNEDILEFLRALKLNTNNVALFWGARIKRDERGCPPPLNALF